MCSDDGSGHGAVSLSERAKRRETVRGLYARYLPGVKRYIRERIGRRREAEDLAQKALLMTSKRQPENPEAYVFAVANNLVVRYRRDQLGRRRAAATLAAAGLDLNLGDEAGRPVSAKQLRRLLARLDVRLSDKLREAIELRLIEGLSCEEAARRLGCSKWAFYKRLERAKQILKEALKRPR
jgi:RNA polymerase sigma-70 factor, ECF subfamily